MNTDPIACSYRGALYHPAELLAIDEMNRDYRWVCGAHKQPKPWIHLPTGQASRERGAQLLGRNGLGPEGKGDPSVVLNFGGGVNSVAAMILLIEHMGVIPRLILMSDPGAEWPETIQYRDEVVNPWLQARGLDPIRVVSRASEAVFRPVTELYETLYGECQRKKMLPSAAYGYKTCSLKYKQVPALWHLLRQRWAQELWSQGERIQKVIGYDAGEERRVKRAMLDPAEHQRFFPSYPLFDRGLDRDGCERLILAAGLPLPRKSACTYCPNSTLDDWIELAANHPEEFEKAVAMSRWAVETLEVPDVVGLMRCNPKGRRQLHLWTGEGGGGQEPDQHCECFT